MIKVMMDLGFNPTEVAVEQLISRIVAHVADESEVLVSATFYSLAAALMYKRVKDQVGSKSNQRALQKLEREMSRFAIEYMHAIETDRLANEIHPVN